MAYKNHSWEADERRELHHDQANTTTKPRTRQHELSLQPHAIVVVSLFG